MIAREHQRDLRADAAAEHDRIAGDSLIRQHPNDVAAHILQRERRARLA